MTGIVLHSADACIGCQYCTWNCSYGVPQYNPERGVVGKCDMCHGRLAKADGRLASSACPEGAIQIEIVNIQEWRRGLCDGELRRGCLRPTIAFRRLASRCPKPCRLTPGKADSYRVAPEHPHWPLVVMMVLTQLSVGAFATIWLLRLFGRCSLARSAAAMVVASRRRRAWCFDAASGPARYACARAEDVATFVAQPRVLLFRVFRLWPALYAAMLGCSFCRR